MFTFDTPLYVIVVLCGLVIILTSNNVTDVQCRFKSGRYACILRVPNPPSGWSDKLASELRKSYQDTDEIYAYCSGRNSNPLLVSVWYCNDIKLRPVTRYQLDCQ